MPRAVLSKDHGPISRPPCPLSGQTPSGPSKECGGGGALVRGRVPRRCRVESGGGLPTRRSGTTIACERLALQDPRGGTPQGALARRPLGARRARSRAREPGHPASACPASSETAGPGRASFANQPGDPERAAREREQRDRERARGRHGRRRPESGEAARSAPPPRAEALRRGRGERAERARQRAAREGSALTEAGERARAGQSKAKAHRAETCRPATKRPGEG